MVGVDRWADTAFAAEEVEDPGLDPGPPVSVRSLRRAIRRRRRLWLTTALLGLILGAAMHVLLPSKVTAISKVYLVEPTSGDPNTAITNDLNLLQTRKVVDTAMQTLNLGPNHALINYKGSTEGTSILTIQVKAPSAATAKAWNNAVAQAFLKVRADLQNEVTSSTVAALQGEVRSLQSEVQGLSGDSSKASVTRQNIDLSQIVTLKHEISQTAGAQASAAANSVVLDPAYVNVKSVKKTIIMDSLSGLIAGLALGITIVIIGELLSDRVRNRADVAAALGAPVELSVGRLR